MECGVEGLMESALYVEDLTRAHQFYERVFGFRELLREENRLHALAVSDKHVLLLFQVRASVRPTHTPGGTIPAHDAQGHQHLAFEIAEQQVNAWRQRLVSLGIAIESEVSCPRGGYSIYFRDEDGHSIEIVTRKCWDLSGV